MSPYILVMHCADICVPHKVTKSRVEIGEAIAGRVVMTGQPLLQQGEGGSSSLMGGLVGEDRIESVICVPVEARSKAIGLIEVFNRLFESFTEEDGPLLSVIGSQVGSIIENSLLYTRLEGVRREVRHRLEELSAMGVPTRYRGTTRSADSIWFALRAET